MHSASTPSARPPPAIARAPGRGRRAARLVVLGTLVATLALMGTTGWSAPAAASPAHGPATNPIGPAAPRSSPSAHAAPGSLDRRTPALSANCAALAAGWATLGAGFPAPPVSPALEKPCTLDPDVAGLYFLSNASGTGARTEIDLTLPANGTGSARDYSEFWLGMWVSGISCSYEGASYLTVELIPPFSAAAGVTGVPYWTVEAPAWDLVPAGSCDPQCQNDTAFFTISGRGYCEDDAVVAGFGALTTSGQGALSPGDELSVTFDGTAGGSGALEVYLNDTTHPTASLAWNYSGGALIGGVPVRATVTGDALEPLFANATSADGGWTGGLNLGFGADYCPAPTSGTSFASACLSYAGDTPLLASPEIDSVEAFNATARTYSIAYPYLETVSSTGACAGAAGMPACADFTTYGGAGVYPVFGLGTGLGRSWYTFAPSGTAGFLPFGRVAGEFAANGSLSGSIASALLGGESVAVGPSSATVSFHANDPDGSARAWVTTWWCSSGTVRAEATYPAALSAAPGSTFEDGNWSAAVATQGDVGTLYYWLRALSFDGTLATSPISSANLTSGTTSCNANLPSRPVLNLTNVAPIGGGYALAYAGNFSAGVTNYTVIATPRHGGPSTDFPEGNLTGVRVIGLAGNVSYNLTVVAANPAGLATPSAPVTAPMTLYPLGYQLVNLSDSSPWTGLAVLHVSANATGGLPPFHFDFGFGDGSSESVWTTSDTASAVHAFPLNYSGVAVITLTIVDTAGDQVATPAEYVSVQGPPLAVPATMAGAAGFIELHWSAPTSPAPITYYKILYTTDPAGAPYLTAATPLNATFAPVNQLIPAPGRTHAAIPAALGTTVYAEVIAWDQYGEGLLPAEPELGEEPYLSATSTPLAGELTSSVPGGSAPLPISFNASFSLAPGDALENATYTFSSGGSLPATIVGANGSFWANVSTVLDHPGIVNVYLHVTDTLSQAAVLTTTVYVAPGAGPSVTVRVAAPPLWANTSLEFSAATTGGSGAFAFNWSFGDGGRATGNPVNYSYVDPGRYIANVTVNDTEYGGVTVVSVPITIFAPPSVVIAETSTSAWGTYRFTAIPFGGYGTLNYTWLFDDGTVATGASTTHTWSAAGNYTVDLDARDGYGHTATASIAVAVPALPPSSSSSGPSTASATLVGALLVLVVALAVVATVLALRRRRPPAGTADAAAESPPEEAPAGEPGAEAPVAETAGPPPVTYWEPAQPPDQEEGPPFR